MRQDRVRAGYHTQQAFADRCGVSRGTLSALERGTRGTYRPETLAAVEAGLGWAPGSITALHDGRPVVRDGDEALAQLHALWPLLGERDRAALVAIARVLAEDR